MRRRQFLRLMIGAATVPGIVRAQQTPRRVGVLVGYLESDQEVQSRLAAFKKRLEELGWREGHNVQITVRFSGTEPSRIQSDAAELVRTADVILASPGQVAMAARQATPNIPIVFANVPDPVGIGLVESLAHPGGNVTGFTSHEANLAGKWLEVLKEIAPHISKVGVLYSPANPAWQARLRIIEAVAPSLGVQITAIGAQHAEELEAAVSNWVNGADCGLILLPSVATMNYREAAVALAARLRLPAVYPWAFVVAAGGLVSYGIDITSQFRDAATYVNRILRGERPSDLPVQAADKFDLVINMKSANALGLTVSPTLIARATDVIE
jgi:putative tryptophan/tyrosine transport system substrate-binding protein